MPPAREEVQAGYPARPLAGKTPPSRPPPSLRKAAALLAQAGDRLPSVLLLNPSGAGAGLCASTDSQRSLNWHSPDSQRG
jgi:hypothetical protein